MRRGFTLMELMIVVVLVTGLTGITAGLVVSIHRTERQTGAYVEDIGHLRRAVRAVETDLRAGDASHYRLEGDVLYRADSVVARRIASFELSRQGPLQVATIALAPRRDVPAARRPAVTVKVRRPR